MNESSTTTPNTARGRLADVISGRVSDRGSALVSMILDSPDDYRLAALDFIAQSSRSIGDENSNSQDFAGEKVLLAVLMAQKGLLSFTRERLQKELKERSVNLVPAMAKLLPVHKGGGLHLLLELATTLADGVLAPSLIPLLKSPDRFAAVLALQAIAASGAEDTISILTSALQNEDLRWTAVALLADMEASASVGPVAHLLADPSPEVRLEAIRALSIFSDQRTVKLLKQVCAADRSQRVRDASFEAVRRISNQHGLPLDEDELLAASTRSLESDREIDQLLAEARVAGASDVHVVPGSPFAFRLHGDIKEIGKDALTSEKTREMILPMVPEASLADLEQDLQLDFSYVVQGLGRHRVNVFQERRGLSAVIRLIPPEVPGFSTLGLPPQVNEVSEYQQGLVLVTGRSGSGKTTTMAAIVNRLNETKSLHIITLEDPIEYIHHRKKSLVNQREIGRHTKSFPVALRSALREDPDVVVVGEMRDLTTMRLAVEAAETGHLVVGTLHTPNAVGAVERLIEAFPATEQQQVRLMLADSLKMVLAQHLIPKKDGPGRVGCFEVLVCTPAVGNLIRDNKINQLPGIMQTGKAAGMKTMDSALFELMSTRAISSKEAYVRAVNKEPFQHHVQNRDGESS